MKLNDLISTTFSNNSKKPVCEKCTYSSRPFVPGYMVDSEIVFIGEAPGQQEVEQKCPFVGKSGQLLRECIRDVGYNDKEFSFLNTVSCNPEGNATPDKESMRICSQNFLFPCLQKIKYKYVVLVGTVALNIFFPGRKILTSHGTILEKDGIKYLPVLHPAFCLRNQNYVPALRKDLNCIKNFTVQKVDQTTEYVLIDNMEKLETYYKVLMEQDLLAVDIETNKTLDPFKHNACIWTIAFGYGKGKAICFPLDHFDIQDERFREELKKAISGVLKSKSKKIFHNVVFDIKWLSKLGYVVTNLHCDTMILLYLLDENRNSYGLKELASEFLQGYTHSFSDVLNELYLYNCADVDNTLQLYNIFWGKLDSKLKELLHSILLPMTIVIAKMELAGVMIDVEYCSQLKEKYLTKISKLTKLIHEEYPQSCGVDFNSPKQLSHLFFKVFGFKPIKKTGSGANSVDGSVLEELSGNGHGIATHLLDVRKYEKLVTTYVGNIPKIIHHDNRIRGSFNIIGTKTGRLSSSNPNLQNIPRDKDIKRMFIAENGYILLNVDASQAELRVASSIANEVTMINAYNTHTDIHKLTASKVLNKDIKDVSEDDRQKAKGVNFGFLYGSSAEGFQTYARQHYKLEFSIQEAQKIRDRFFSTYTELVRWYSRVRSEVGKFGYIRYPTGRYRRFPEIKVTGLTDDMVRKAINSPVQGSSSDIVLYSMVCLNKFFEKVKYAKLLLTVHDSFLIESKKSLEEDVIAEVLVVAQHLVPKRFPWLKVPWVFDFQAGVNWGEMKKVKIS